MNKPSIKKETLKRLISYITKKYKFRFKVGDIATEQSKGCVFAIVSYTGAVLRMATTYEQAKVLTDDNYRFVFEAKIKLK